MDERFLIGQPVKSLQYMLGELSYERERLPFVAPDGVFGEATLEAVMTFQREYGLPVTGQVDQRTWDAVVAQFRDMERQRAHPRCLRAFPPRPFQVAPGERDDTMILVQTMFQSLAPILSGIVPGEVNGFHGPRSVSNTRWLQRVSGLEETGIMDRFTWNMLARLYETFLVRQRELSWPEEAEEGPRKNS